MVDTKFYLAKQNVTLAEVAEVTSAVLTDQTKAGETIKSLATMNSATGEDICFFYEVCL